MCIRKHARIIFSAAGFVILILSTASAQFVQQGPKLVGSGAVGNANQGNFVALSADGNTAFVGGFTDNNYVGAAWAYTRDGGVWTQQGSKLTASDAAGQSRQGCWVKLSADGNTALVTGTGDDSGAGAAWIYTRSGGVWTQQGPKLVGSGAVGKAQQGVDAGISDDGNTIIVGGYYDSGFTGAAWIFTRSGGVWTQQGSKLVGAGAVGPADQGLSVAISGDGNTIAVGGAADNNGAGAVWIFARDTNGVWKQQGNKLVGTGAVGNAWQGGVALSGDGNTLMLAGIADNSHAGAIWMYTRTDGTWTQQGNKLVGTGAIGSAQQGWSYALSADGNTAIEGGISDNGSEGAAWVFSRTGDEWKQLGPKIVGANMLGNPVCYGFSVALSADGTTAMVGAPYDSTYAGAAWVYTRISQWTPLPSIASVRDVPHDQGGRVTLTWNASGLDDNLNSLPFYSIWRAMPAGSSLAQTQFMNVHVTKDFRGQSFRQSAVSGVPYNWEWIANQPAHKFASYAFTAPTLYDSMPGTNGITYFLVSAQTNDPNLFYDSPVDSGYSVDNLAPMPPHNLIAAPSGNSVTLHWNQSPDADLGKYAVYRSPDSITSVSALQPYALCVDTMFVDNAPLLDGFYLVRAVDIHDNYSTSSNEIRLVVTGVEESGRGIPTSYALSQNYPNPFNPSTVINYNLVDQQHVRISIYNMLGQEVLTPVDGVERAGYKSVTVNLNSLPSGIYLYRISAGTFTDAKKMVLIK